jgi:hydrogenase expression/formation protein HypE
MGSLIQDIFATSFSNPFLAPLHDGAIFSVDRGRLALTTDSYVVRPLFFPGGNIGSLAVHGTINDLAMCGAKPLYLSAGFILEEGLEIETLKQIVHSMAAAAAEAHVQIICGDTKVVDRGKGDQLYINTTGVGMVPHDVDIGPHRIQAGDRILVSGDLGSHGIAVLSVREGLTFSGDVRSDSTALHGIVQDLLDHGISLHCLRDLTRGGLTSALNELAEGAKANMLIKESQIPIGDAVRGACEILGLDPLYVVNEGRFVIFLPASESEKALSILRTHSASHLAANIGEVLAPPTSGSPLVTIRTLVGTTRILDLLSGEQLPRIC